MYIAHTDPELTNVTIAGNSAAFGGAITYNNSSNNMTITNSVIWGNSSGINTPGGGAPSIFYSLVQGNGGTTGTGNLDGTNTGNEPDFVNPIMASAAPTSFGDYQLQPGSPVINKGDDNNYLTARGISNFTGETDLAGESRQTGAKIDMGAYEKQ
jgi:hypothetical protein